MTLTEVLKVVKTKWEKKGYKRIRGNNNVKLPISLRRLKGPSNSSTTLKVY